MIQRYDENMPQGSNILHTKIVITEDERHMDSLSESFMSKLQIAWKTGHPEMDTLLPDVALRMDCVQPAKRAEIMLSMIFRWAYNKLRQGDSNAFFYRSLFNYVMASEPYADIRIEHTMDLEED